MFICVCILVSARTLAIFVRNALLIRVTLRNISAYIIMNIHLVEVFVINALVNIFISEYLHVVSEICS